MNIVVIGYGKMGKTIERLATQQGHQVIGTIDINTPLDMRTSLFKEVDVAIEFSHPDAAYDNISQALNAKIPVVSGTTGWLDQLDEIKNRVAQNKGAFFYASNFSIGVNIMFAMNEKLAAIMNNYSAYDVSMEETHHIHKKDAPSGTALTLANGVLKNIESKNKWSLEKNDKDSLHINALREGEVFGIHKVTYQSKIDKIELYHEAFTRDGFALGAILAAEWLIGRHGVYSMKDMMGL